MIDTRPSVALTLGDPAGIGPELAAKLLSVPGLLDRARIHLLADRTEVEAAFADARLPLVPLSDDGAPGTVWLRDDGTAPARPIEIGVVSREAGERAMHQLRRAVALVKAGEVGAITFMPLNKTSLHLAGMHEEDELRWFAKELDFDGTTSELNVLEGLWTARVTSHIPMKEVAERITAANVTAAIRLLHEVLVDAGREPRIGVAALNPHNGENGNFGREEIEEIAPGVEADMGGGDQWPQIREKILAADVLVLSSPIWLGHPASVTQRVLERLDAELSNTDEQERPVMVGKVALVAVVGNEDGAHKVVADLFQALNDVGYSIPAQGCTYWNGPAMESGDYKDLDEVPEQVASTTAAAARNAAHLARALKQAQYPSYQ